MLQAFLAAPPGDEPQAKIAVRPLASLEKPWKPPPHCSFFSADVFRSIFFLSFSENVSRNSLKLPRCALDFLQYGVKNANMRTLLFIISYALLWHLCCRHVPGWIHTCHQSYVMEAYKKVACPGIRCTDLYIFSVRWYSSNKEHLPQLPQLVALLSSVNVFGLLWVLFLRAGRIWTPTADHLPEEASEQTRSIWTRGGKHWNADTIRPRGKKNKLC